MAISAAPSIYDVERQGQRLILSQEDLQLGDTIVQPDGSREQVVGFERPEWRFRITEDGQPRVAEDGAVRRLEEPRGRPVTSPHPAPPPAPAPLPDPSSAPAPVASDQPATVEPIAPFPQAVLRSGARTMVDTQEGLLVGDVYADIRGDQWRVRTIESNPGGRSTIHVDHNFDLPEEQLSAKPVWPAFMTGGGIGTGAIGEHPISSGGVFWTEEPPEPPATRRRGRRAIFVETAEHGALTRTEFRSLPKADKLAVMEAWFGENYEEPEHHTPRDSGEWVWIHGGPYDALDELSGKFGGLARDAWIEEVVTKVQSDGTYDWAGVPSAGDTDESRLDDGEPLLLDGGAPPRPPNGGYDDRRYDEAVYDAGPAIPDGGQPPNMAIAHQAMVQQLLAFEAQIAAMPVRRPGMGGNNPPDQIECPFTEAEQADMLAASQALRSQLAEPPDLGAAARPLLEVLAAKRTKMVAWLDAARTTLKDQAIDLGKDMAKDVIKDSVKEAIKMGVGSAVTAAILYWEKLALAFDGALATATAWLQSLLPF